MNLDNEETVFPLPQAQRADSLSAGAVFAHYRVIRLLGRGGMGEVYEVEHVDLNTRHALKLIHPDIVARGDSGERFRREAKVMATLKHAHIVHVDDFRQAEGRSWLRMELLGGGSLGDRIAEAGGKLPEAEARDVLRQILEGLAYAHGEGVVHRDLKPANILMEADNRIKIADFGLVRLAGEQWLQSQVQQTVARSMALSQMETRIGAGSDGTSTKALLGTFAYMSPEQKRGEEVDHRSDLYAVGLMAYQMLTGLDSLGLQLPSKIDKRIDPAWDDWIATATMPNRDARFASAEEMLKQLPGAERGKTAAKPAQTAGRGIFKWVAGLAAVAVLGAGAYYAKGHWLPVDAGDEQGLEITLTNRELANATDLTIKLDGQSLSATPRNGKLSLTGLEIGRRTLEISHPTHKSHTSHPVITDQRTTAHSVTLEPLPGQLTLQVSGPPAGQWTVEVNGKAATLASGNTLELPAGTAHTLRINARGWQAAEQSVTLAAAERRTLPFRLEEARGPVPGQNAQVELPGGLQMSFTWVSAMNMWVGTYEVTNAEFRSFRSGHDSGDNFNGPRQPVVEVNYNDAVTFCEWLTDRERAAGRLPEGYRFRLPDGNEWTRFAQCGTNRTYPWGNSMPPTRGNYSNSISGYNSGAGRTVDVDNAGRNEWGLYGVGGNVWEWTSERGGSSRVVRGGSWLSDFEVGLRVEGRGDRVPSNRFSGIGFRVVCGR